MHRITLAILGLVAVSACAVPVPVTHYLMVRRLSQELLPGETMWLHAPEQEKAKAAGLMLPRDNVGPIQADKI